MLCNELYFHKEIVIERKNSLEELSGNLGKGRERFEKEFLKARNNGCSIHLMVENPQGLNDIMKHNYNMIVTGEDVEKQKPDPEGYCRAMEHFGVTPADTMIFEDSGIGLTAAKASGARVFRVEQF